MTKIFEVRIAMYAVVAADNENHAYEVARRNASSILSDDGNPYIDVLCEAKTLQDLGNGWNGDCLPYGGDCKTTLSKLLKSNAPQSPAAKQSACIEGLEQSHKGSRDGQAN